MTDSSNTKGPASRRKVAALVLLFTFIVDTYADNQNLPPMVSCTDGFDCKENSNFIRPFPECIDGLCSCNNTVEDDPKCLHYTMDYNRDKEIHYFCAPCGTIGSICNKEEGCKIPGDCKSDLEEYGYCECTIGEPCREICVHYKPVSTSRGTIAMIIVLIFMLIINKCISSHAFIRRRCLVPIMTRMFCCRSCSYRWGLHMECVQAQNPQSGTKTASYTIAGRNFMACSDDPDLQWALDLSSSSQLSSRRDVDIEAVAGTSSSTNLSSQRRRRRVAEVRPNKKHTNEVVETELQQKASFRSITSETSKISSCPADDEESLYSSVDSSPRASKIRTTSLPLKLGKTNRIGTEILTFSRDEFIMNQILKNNIEYTSHRSDSSVSTTISTLYSSNSFTEDFTGETTDRESDSCGSFVSSCVVLTPEVKSEIPFPLKTSKNSDSSDSPPLECPSLTQVLFYEMILPLSIVLSDKTLLFLHKSQLSDPTDSVLQNQ